MQLLVIEDNDAMAEAIQRGLIAEGFNVDVEHNGLDGIWRIREFDYAAIVLDVMLPGLNGYKICRTVRSEGIKTPILMLTAKDGEYDIAEGLDLGANDYLTKPFSFVVLAARVRALVRQGHSSTNSLIVGDLKFDMAARSCSLRGSSIDLTPREYALLETLARHVGQPLTRSQLLVQAWGADHVGDSNVVDVYIGYLRKKLARNKLDGEPIETVRGIGYRLAAK